MAGVDVDEHLGKKAALLTKYPHNQLILLLSLPYPQIVTLMDAKGLSLMRLGSSDCLALIRAASEVSERMGWMEYQGKRMVNRNWKRERESGDERRGMK